MPFLMSVALQVAIKLFDQQAAKLPTLFCSLILMLQVKYQTRNLTCDNFLKPNSTPTIPNCMLQHFFTRAMLYGQSAQILKTKSEQCLSQ